MVVFTGASNFGYSQTSPVTTLSFLCRMPQEIFSYKHLFDFTKAILQKIGCSEAHAAISAKVLLAADLRGIDSHGVARLSGYVRLWEKGLASLDE